MQKPRGKETEHARQAGDSSQVLQRFVGQAGALCVPVCLPLIPSGDPAAGSLWAQWASVCRLRWASEMNWELHLDLENHRALPPCRMPPLTSSCRLAVSNACESHYSSAGGMLLLGVCGLESLGFLVFSGNAWKSSPSVFQPQSPSGKQPAAAPSWPPTVLSPLPHVGPWNSRV